MPDSESQSEIISAFRHRALSRSSTPHGTPQRSFAGAVVGTWPYCYFNTSYRGAVLALSTAETSSPPTTQPAATSGTTLEPAKKVCCRVIS